MQFLILKIESLFSVYMNLVVWYIKSVHVCDQLKVFLLLFQVDGLTALILCSGVVVAAGNEPFRLGNYSFHRTGQVAQGMYTDTAEPSMLQPRTREC